MKFLCVECDQPMKLLRTGPPDSRGSLSVVFACPSCDWSFRMLTNPYETQVVSSLGVKIGGSTVPASATSKTDRNEPASGPGCPFGDLVQRMGLEQPAAEEGPVWSAAALARLEKIPEFIRPMARKGIEQIAREQGLERIDEEVLEMARARLGG